MIAVAALLAGLAIGFLLGFGGTCRAAARAINNGNVRITCLDRSPSGERCCRARTPHERHVGSSGAVWRAPREP
jgi:hypothetical protein